MGVLEMIQQNKLPIHFTSDKWDEFISGSKTPDDYLSIETQFFEADDDSAIEQLTDEI